MKLAGGVPVILQRIPCNAVDSSFQMISNSYRNSQLHRVPHDLDFAKAIEDQATGIELQATAKELVAKYQRTVADFPERKLVGNAAWRLVLACSHGRNLNGAASARLPMILDATKLCPDARQIIESSRHLVVASKAPISSKMFASKDFDIMRAAQSFLDVSWHVTNDAFFYI